VISTAEDATNSRFSIAYYDIKELDGRGTQQKQLNRCRILNIPSFQCAVLLAACMVLLQAWTDGSKKK
jgi:hypothetical protein